MKTKIVLAIALLALAAAPHLLPEFYTALLNYVGLSVLVVIGIVLLTGVAGLTSFGQAAFVGIAAYSTAFITLNYGASPGVGLLVGVGLAMAAATFIGAATLRLSGHYLALSTLAWGMSFYYLFGNLQFLGGQTGLTGIPAIQMMGVKFDSPQSYFYIVWIAVALALLLSVSILNSRIGRALRLIHGAEQAAASMGVQTFQAKLGVFVFSALLAAVSGWLYAHMLRFVNPTPFSLTLGIEYLFMAVIGGVAHLGGAILGAATLTALNQALQSWLPLIVGKSANLEGVVFGALMIILLQRAPQGIAGTLVARLAVGRTAVVPKGIRLEERRLQPSVATTLLSVQELSKSFGGLAAVQHVSFDVGARTIVALIGPNGAGKSTTFNMISGLIPPDRGRVRLSDVTLTGKSPRSVALDGVARTFQHPMFKPSMSVLENVAVGAHGRGHAGFFRAAIRANGAEEKRLLAEAYAQLERVGLADYAHRPASALPLGHQRTMEIARALSADPLLLLLDEPAAGLRAREKEELATLLRQLRREGVTILLVEHDMQFVLNLADKVVVMDFGIKIAEGTPAEIRRNPRVIEAYLGVEHE